MLQACKHGGLAVAMLLAVACSSPPPAAPQPANGMPADTPADTQATTVAPAAVAPPAATGSAAAPRIAIIIDDIGNNRFMGLQAAGLQGQVTLAVMPHTPHAHDIANAAHALGKELMLHMPMSNTADKYATRDTLRPGMTREALAGTLADAIASVPHIRGLNNHTGSELTALQEPMAWLMQELRCHDLYFIDSRTTPASVAAQQAAAAGIPHASRQVFLDNEPTRAAIDLAFRRLLRIARSEGSAIGIGHPYPATLAYLQEAIGYLPALGIELVFASELVHDPLPSPPAGGLNPPLQTGNLVSTTPGEPATPATEAP